jgi:N-acetylmuramic acid 6-phosphate etherase
VQNKKQCQLQNLVTEQRHPKTLQLSYEAVSNTQQGLESLFAVDEDITIKFAAMAQDPAQMKVLTAVSQTIQTALLQRKKSICMAPAQPID